ARSSADRLTLLPLGRSRRVFTVRGNGRADRMTPPASPPPSAPRIPVESLLEHGAFLRRLAGRLVRDEADADDLLQDAYRIALESRGSPPATPRAWLSGILRNRARRLARDAV